VLGPGSHCHLLKLQCSRQGPWELMLGGSCFTLAPAMGPHGGATVGLALGVSSPQPTLAGATGPCGTGRVTMPPPAPSPRRATRRSLSLCHQWGGSGGEHGGTGGRGKGRDEGLGWRERVERGDEGWGNGGMRGRGDEGKRG